jgi:hypothetical protein
MNTLKTAKKVWEDIFSNNTLNFTTFEDYYQYHFKSMSEANHYKAIVCIEKRIKELQKELDICYQVIENTQSDITREFASSDKENFELEIKQLRETLQELIK